MKSISGKCTVCEGVRFAFLEEKMKYERERQRAIESSKGTIVSQIFDGISTQRTNLPFIRIIVQVDGGSDNVNEEIIYALENSRNLPAIDLNICPE